MGISSFHFAKAGRLRRVFLVERDERLVARALAAGLVSAPDVAEARRLRDQTDPDGLLTELMVARGWLGALALERVRDEEAHEEFGRATTAEARPLPDEVVAWEHDPDRRVGDFILIRELGGGGTASVWKAWDCRLGRFVAIKLSTLAIEAASARERFEREALAAGRLAHPNIITVFQVGNLRGRPYLVMPFIEGQALDQIPPADLTVGRALQIVLAAARAVDHAHRQGIVHRDLKPANIMVDREGGVFVLDFGLAYLKEDSAARLTRPGDMMGTASYMAPEQARGGVDAPGPTIDVYGLGATLYFLVTGRAPFVGPSVEVVIARVLSATLEAPSQVRSPLDPRINAVVLRGMEKDPRDRYASAAAFADDLQRIVDDRPVEARPLRRVRRVPGRTVAWVALALLVATLGVGAAVRARIESRASVVALTDLGRLSLNTALRLRRAGDTAGMRQVLPALVGAYDRVVARGAESAEVEYLMGRMYRALLNDDRALPHIERSLALDPQFAPARYEHAVLLSRRYGKDLAAVRSLEGDSRLSPAVIKAVDKDRPSLAAVRRQILDDCRRLSLMPQEAARAATVRGMLALHQGNLAEARAHVQPALALDPLIEEAWETLARIEEADGRVEQSEDVYSRGLALDRGYVPLLVGRCGLRAYTGRPVEARADADAALAIAPDSLEARVCRASARLKEAHDQILKGRDPIALLTAAAVDSNEVLRHKELPVVLWYRAAGERYRGIFVARRGEDPSVHFDRAVSDLDRQIALEPGHSPGWTSRGRTRTRMAMYLLSMGRDPIPTLHAAIEDLLHAVLLNQGDGESRLYLGDAYGYRGLAEAERGQPADASFAASEAAFAEAVNLGNDSGWLRLCRGNLRLARGLVRAVSGADGLADFSEAEADLSEAVRLFPAYADPVAALGRLRMERGLFLQRRRDPRSGVDLLAAARDIDRALAIDPLLALARAASVRLCATRESLCRPPIP